MGNIVDTVVALCTILILWFFALPYCNKNKEKRQRMEERITVLEHKCDSLQRQIDFMVE